MHVIEDRAKRVGDVGQIRLAMAIERRWHAHQNDIDLARARKVGGGRKAPRGHHVGDGFGFEVSEIGAARIEALDLAGIDVKADDAIGAARENGERQRQADVPQPINADHGGTRGDLGAQLGLRVQRGRGGFVRQARAPQARVWSKPAAAGATGSAWVGRRRAPYDTIGHALSIRCRRGDGEAAALLRAARAPHACAGGSPRA